MNRIDLRPFPNDELLAGRAALDWIESVEEAAKFGEMQFVALSGGRIARRFFDEAAKVAGERNTSFAHVHFFWADERSVPPLDAESNFALASRHFFQLASVAEKNIHRIGGELEPREAARLASEELQRGVPRRRDGVPELDLVFLGMGEDGHVASLFPEEPTPVRERRDLFREVTATKPPPQRVTISYHVICAARQVWVMASGAGKQAALRQSLAPDGQSPLAQVLRKRDETRIYTDIPAG